MNSVVKGSLFYTLPETNSSHQKTGRNPKGNDLLPTIHFQVILLMVKQLPGIYKTLKTMG